jgi:hypothetical protein
MRSAVAALTACLFAAVVVFAPAGKEAAGQPKVAPKTETTPKKEDPKKEDPKKEEKKAEPVEEKFDQKKADIDTVKAAGYAVDGKALQEFFHKHTVTDADRARLATLIKQLGDDDFD